MSDPESCEADVALKEMETYALVKNRSIPCHYGNLRVFDTCGTTVSIGPDYLYSVVLIIFVVLIMNLCWFFHLSYESYKSLAASILINTFFLLSML